MAFLRTREESCSSRPKKMKKEAPRAVLSDISNKPAPIAVLPTAKAARSNAHQNPCQKAPNAKKRKLNQQPPGVESKKPKNIKSDNVLEYADDLYTALKSKENTLRPSPTYFDKQPVLTPKMRTILFNWLIEVHLKFKLERETLFLTLDLVDKYLDVEVVARSKLQLVGCTAMLVASKYSEMYAPEVRDFEYISDKAYTPDEIIKMESIMLSKLEYRLALPTCYHFCDRYLNICGADALTMNLCYYYMESVLLDLRSLKYLPSQIASGCLLAALKSRNRGQLVSKKNIEAWCGYTSDELQEFTSLLKGIILRPNPNVTSIKKKYSMSKFKSVGKISRSVLMRD